MFTGAEDDINFSEIVVHDRDGERGQLIVNPNPTQNQYGAPEQTHFVIDDMDSLAPVPEAVRHAAREAQRPNNFAWITSRACFWGRGSRSPCCHGSTARGVRPVPDDMRAGHVSTNTNEMNEMDVMDEMDYGRHGRSCFIPHPSSLIFHPFLPFSGFTQKNKR